MLQLIGIQDAASVGAVIANTAYLKELLTVH